MADADFTLKLIDMMTGPARRAAASANALVAKLKATEASAEAAGKAGQHMAKLEQATNKAATAAERLAVAEARAGQVAAAAAQKAAAAKVAGTNRVIAAAMQDAAAQRKVRTSAAAAEQNARFQWYAQQRQNKQLAADIMARTRVAAQAQAAKRWSDKAAAHRPAWLTQRQAQQARWPAQQAQQAQQPAQQAAGGLSGMMASFGGNLLAGVVSKVASVVASIVSALAQGAVTLGKWVLGAAMFADRQKTALSILLKSSSAGAAAYKDAIGLAGKYGLAVQDTAVAYTALVKQGFSTAQAKELVTMSADLKAVGASAEQIQSVMQGIAKIKAAGNLQGDELNILAEAGINVDLVYKQLAKTLGKSVADVRKLKEAGKITSDQAIEAIKAATLETMGTSKLGEAADRMSKTLGGAWDRFKSKAEIVLLSIGEKLVPKMVDKVVPMLDKLMAWADSAEGAKFVDNMVEGLGSIVDAISKIDVDDVTSAIEDVGEAFTWVRDAIKAVGIVAEGTWKFLKTTPLVVAIRAVIAVVEQLIATYEKLKTLLDDIGLGGEAAQAGGLDKSTMPKFLDGDGLSASMSAGGKAAGTALVQGIVDGIMGGLGAVARAATSASQAAITASQSSLDAHSPSRVFRDLYASVPAGAVQGITEGSPRVQSAAASMISSASVGGTRTTNSTVRTHAPVNITIPAAADPQATAAIVAATLESRLAGIFQDLSLQVGVVGTGAAT